jgi:hypothetical protein
MVQIGLIGIGAGAAAALLFASVTSGSWLAVMLFYLAPLPIMIAGLGWSHWAALIAAAGGALALGVVFSSIFLFAFLASAGIPAWWLTYLAMLARPAAIAPAGGPPGSAALEWYPPGRLVIWAAALGALAVLIAMLNFGFDSDAFRTGLGQAVAQLLRLETGNAPDAGRSQRLIEFLVEAIPPAAAVIATLTHVANLWLAASVVRFSGRLHRPWPALSALAFPRTLAPVLAVAVILSFAGGMVGIVAGVISASLLIACGVLGFAVLHAITQGMNARGLLLGGAYAAVLVFGWPILALCVLGLIDLIFDLRGRIARKRGPPART